MGHLRFEPASIRRKQRGAVLVTSMLLLLVLTIIGVTAMQMSRMQERMTGNTRDRNLAFQAAEGAARAGEAVIRQQVLKPVSCSASPCQVWQQPPIAGAPLAAPNPNGRVDLQSGNWWRDANVVTTVAALAPGLNEAPAYAIEELAYVRTDGGVVLGEEDGRDFYRITGRSTGGSGLAEVIVQTTFTRKF